LDNLAPPQSFSACPLVTVGVPTYNRANQLERTLNALRGQTYPNLEIIVSDNASEDENVRVVVMRAQAIDSRIKYVLQETNRGAAENFIRLAEMASGEYFVWAADDDFLEEWFMERCVGKFLSHSTLSLVMAEVQYFVDDHPMAVLLQGESFRRIGGEASAINRMAHAFRRNYDNLVYGMFKRNALLLDGKLFWASAGLRSGNELPAILYAAWRGEIHVMPDVGMRKATSAAAYEQIKWQTEGGRLSKQRRVLRVKDAFATWDYFSAVEKDVFSAFDLMGLRGWERMAIKLLVWTRIRVGWLQFVYGWKPKATGLKNG
jgi:glycosyltransferase involved in cell wall biosynthesis